MACRDFEQLVALFVEDDLPPTERRHTEEHLRGCAPCARLAEELKESQSLFKSIRQQVPTQTMLAAVRTRVLGRAHTRVSWFERIFLSAFGQRATLAGIALLVVGSALWIWKQPADVPIPEAPRVTPLLPAPVPMPAVATHVTEVKPVRRRPAPVVDSKPDAPKETTIKWLTDDPNIVIYWVVEEKGD